MTHSFRRNPLPEIAPGHLGTPSRTSTTALYRVTAVVDPSGERVGHDLPLRDASFVAREMMYGRGYRDVTLCRVR